jgi:hypothetical protein
MKNILQLILIFVFFFSFASCASSSKRNKSFADYQIDEDYYTDDYYQNENYSNFNNDSHGGVNGDLIESIKNKIWQLIEIRIGYGLVALDREQMAYNNLNDIYIIQFTDEGVSGKAAPNRYFASYEKREGKNVSIRQIVGTLMASNINIGGLMENEYYWYLQRITRIDLVNGYLELYANPSPNEEIVLRYRPD